MNKQSRYITLLLLLALFSLGILVGISVINDNEDNGIELIETTEQASTANLPAPFTVPATETADIAEHTGNNQESTLALEDRITSLEARIVELEQSIYTRTDNKTTVTPSRSEVRINQLNNLQTKQSLLKAGITEVIANDIIRRRNELELKKLELHDTASREGYLGSARYESEYSELVADEKTLREELGDDVYDYYLFANGQPNRVKAISVIMGSSAEQSGMQDGDIIVNYGQHRIFEWNELKQATTEGLLGEYVNVDIIRNSQFISLSVPRGPLGVRLGTARISP